MTTRLSAQATSAEDIVAAFVAYYKDLYAHYPYTVVECAQQICGIHAMIGMTLKGGLILRQGHEGSGSAIRAEVVQQSELR
ncbi:hypothetical protein NDU88_002154 [Pleurodeles waltl]|uniref:Uncharacterized protein n=1 Tax=Pleurodeles waltl TaxID=8319 RepID=A0AAV7UXX4_PLEWA|nr:hypothetical protein NDU88_002154 [Pleurodeles waltl]